MRSFTTLTSFVAVTLSLIATTSQADLLVSRRAHKPLVSVAARDALPEWAQEKALPTDGVFHLPLTLSTEKVSNITSGLVRRGGGGDGEVIDMNFNSLTIPIAINGKAYTYQVVPNDESVLAFSVKDDPKAWNPANDKKATKNGNTLTNLYKKTADPWKVAEFSIGKSVLKNVGVLYQQTFGDKASDWQGLVGFGPPGSGTYSASKSSFLKAISDSKVLARDCYTFILNAGTDVGAKLLLGATDPKALWVPCASKDRWTVAVDIGGHKGVADLTISEDFIIAPTEVAKDLITKAGLTYTESVDGDVVANDFDCKKDVADTVVRLAKGKLTFRSKFGVDDEGKKCSYPVKGAKQGDYPTAYSLGLIAFTRYNIGFEFIPGKYQIGFSGIPGLTDPPA